MWLAGILGLIGLGAATYVSTNTVEEDDDAAQTAVEESESTVDLVHGTPTDGLVAVAQGFSDDPDAQTALDPVAEPDPEDEVRVEDEGPVVESVWAEHGAPSTVTDFVPQDDSLVFIWDDTGGAEDAPEIAMQSDPENAGHLQILIGDQVVAQISGPDALEDAEIAMIPQSSAQAMDLIPA